MGTQDRIEIFGDGRICRCGIRIRMFDGLFCCLRNHPVLSATLVGLGLVAGGFILFSAINLWPEIKALMK